MNLVPLNDPESVFIQVAPSEFLVLNQESGMLAFAAASLGVAADWRWIVSDGETYLYLRRDNIVALAPFPARLAIERTLKEVLASALEHLDAYAASLDSANA
jgi:hypothetical protein